MRLTLRTLLAYLDRILDTEDARELDTKIRDNDVAKQLVDRIQLRLAELPSSLQGSLSMSPRRTSHRFFRPS